VLHTRQEVGCRVSASNAHGNAEVVLRAETTSEFGAPAATTARSGSSDSAAVGYNESAAATIGYDNFSSSPSAAVGYDNSAGGNRYQFVFFNELVLIRVADCEFIFIRERRSGSTARCAGNQKDDCSAISIPWIQLAGLGSGRSDSNRSLFRLQEDEAKKEA
jgi:hypothetical protein